MGTGVETAPTERHGVTAVAHLFSSEFGWFFREQTVSDFGIDAQVEIIENGQPTGRLIALQIKSGASFFRRRSDGSYTFRGERRHLEYWSGHCLPVFLILHNPQTNQTLWQRIAPHLITETEKYWKVAIPETNVLDSKAKTFIAAGISSDQNSIKRQRFASDKALMLDFKDKAVYFRFDVWVNKILSIRGIDVYLDDPGKDTPDLNIPYWAAMHSVHEVMAHYFPWADYEYEDYEPDAGGGEIESHLFSVQLNDAALDFLQLEEFFDEATPIKDISPFDDESHEDSDDEHGRERFYGNST
jgi:hypothetical protein